MEPASPLYGACSCGRNQYEILFVEPTTARVLFDDSRETRHTGGALLPALLLQVPLSALRSTTYAFYPEETHTEIRRAFTPRHAPRTKRHFCGFCGTPLSFWSETDPAQADSICVNLSSLESDSVLKLDELGLLPSSDDEADDEEKEGLEGTDNARPQEQEVAPTGEDGTAEGRAVARSREEGVTTGRPWVEEFVQGSRAGRMRRRRGGHESRDGTVKVEWEIVEFNGEEVPEASETAASSKRKIGEMAGDDVVMGGRQ